MYIFDWHTCTFCIVFLLISWKLYSKSLLFRYVIVFFFFYWFLHQMRKKVSWLFELTIKRIEQNEIQRWTNWFKNIQLATILSFVLFFFTWFLYLLVFSQTMKNFPAAFYLLFILQHSIERNSLVTNEEKE